MICALCWVLGFLCWITGGNQIPVQGAAHPSPAEPCVCPSHQARFQGWGSAETPSHISYLPLLAGCTRENLQNLSVQNISALCILDLDLQEISFAELVLQVLDGADAPAGQGGTEMKSLSLLLLPEQESTATKLW